MAARTLLFAYGSMRQGEPNEWRMEHVGASHRGRAILRDHRLYTARRSDGRWIAYAVPEVDHTVIGDLFAVPADKLAWIDRFEGHPHFYLRVTAPVDVVVRTVPRVPALVYGMPRERLPAGARPCPTGDWIRCRPDR